MFSFCLFGFGLLLFGINRGAEFRFLVVAVADDSDVCLWIEAGLLGFFGGAHINRSGILLCIYKYTIPHPSLLGRRISVHPCHGLDQ